MLVLIASQRQRLLRWLWQLKELNLYKGWIYQPFSGIIILLGSWNIPLQELGRAAKIVNYKDTPLFVHCLSGGRSRQATAVLKQMGYTNVTNIGGIADYNGKVER